LRKYIIFVAFFVVTVCYTSAVLSQELNEKIKTLEVPITSLSVANPPKKLIKILSIDGGGVRGVIPATILANLESRLPPGHHLAECFDIIAGTSAGGIIALLLATPNAQGKPKYNASFIAKEIGEVSKEAFSRSYWQALKSAGGWLGAKYDETVLKEKLAFYFQDIQLKQTVCNVIVPAYEIEQDKTFFFKSSRAKNERQQDCYLKDLAYATSAAPTYFRPARLIDGTNQRTLTLIDGGVSANNPTIAAAVHAIELHGTNIELFIVSIGTGTKYGSQKKKITYESVKNSGMLGWAKSIVPLLMYTADAIVDYEMYYVLNFNKPQYYFRLQTTLEPENAALDDVSDHNIELLKIKAHDLIKKFDKDLDYIANVLASKTYIFHPREKGRISFN
jgi:patatin-like phospholipase/acyl hydrolase